MLCEIRIKNLALIEELSLEFESGFSIFTGETGAGKSILVGAIGLLLGERASADMVRNGFDEAEVSGTFSLTDMKPALRKLLEELEISPDDGQLIIRRKISRNDRNRILVNQVSVPLGSLKQIGNFLIDFHGQHEHQSLLDEEEHVRIIDNLPDVFVCRRKYDEAYMEYSRALDAFEKHEKHARQLAERRDMLEFQNSEIKNMNLKIGEEEELENKLSLLSSSAERISCASGIIEVLGYGDESIEKKVSIIRRKLETLVKYDSAVEPWLGDVESALSTFTELETFCASYLDHAGGAADPAKIEHINSRLAKIQRLKKKYGATLEQLIEKQKQIEKDLESLENASSDSVMLERKAASALALCKEAGGALSVARRKNAEKLCSAVSDILKRLGFSSGRLAARMDPLEKATPNGLETVVFEVQTNTGEPFLPLAKTASGGEISRIMLAIKSVLSGHDQVPVLIFDEIDTGIGGVLASEVGHAMYELSRSHQLLCISHLHQIASLADHHFRVYKETASGRTITHVVNLDKKEKIREIARMLGGDSEISLKHAAELIENGQRKQL